MSPNLLIDPKVISSYIQSELFYILLIMAYLGLYFLGIYLSSKPKIPFFKAAGLTTILIGTIIFTITGGNFFIGIIVALSHIIIASIIRMTSRA